MNRARVIMTAAVISLLLIGCGFFPESTFTLSPESRLPSWLKLPPGHSRSDVEVSMSYFVGLTGRTARFTMSTPNGDPIAKVTGKLSGLNPTDSPDSRSGYPGYEVIIVDGVVEVIEHRDMQPIFYVTDDAEVLKRFGLPTSNKRLERSRVAYSVSQGGGR
jgi:hypothetical protein